MSLLIRSRNAPVLFFPEPLFDPDVTYCRGCGRRDLDACDDDESNMACHWVEPDLCSDCAAEYASRLDPEMASLYAEDAE